MLLIAHAPVGNRPSSPLPFLSTPLSSNNPEKRNKPSRRFPPSTDKLPRSTRGQAVLFFDARNISAQCLACKQRTQHASSRSEGKLCRARRLALLSSESQRQQQLNRDLQVKLAALGKQGLNRRKDTRLPAQFTSAFVSGTQHAAVVPQNFVCRRTLGPAIGRQQYEIQSITNGGIQSLDKTKKIHASPLSES